MCRKLFNRAKKSGDWETYKSVLTYNKAIRDAKRNSWQQFCVEIEHVSTMARDRNCRLNTIKVSNGKLTNSRGETPAEMLRIHFPNSKVVTGPILSINLPTINCGKHKWTIAKKIVRYERVVTVFLI